LVAKCGSYAEITPSGTGLRIIGYGNGPYVHNRQKINNVVSLETFRQATRYITITGNPLPGSAALVSIDAHIDELVPQQQQAQAKSDDECDDVDPYEVAAVVACIPPPATRDDRVAIGHAIKACVADGRIAFAIFDTLLQSCDDYKLMDHAAKWRGFHPNRTGYGALYNRMMEGGGWLADAHLIRFAAIAMGDAPGRWQWPGHPPPPPPSTDPQSPTADTNQPFVLMVELARKLWGEGQRIANGHWAFGDVRLDVWHSSWFNLTTGEHGDLPALMTKAAGSNGDEKPKSPSLTLIDFSKWDTEPVPQQDYSVAGRIPMGHVTLFSGEGAAGKSTLYLQLAIAHALEHEWLRAATRCGPAML
jgi:hypothetical protein